MTILLIMKLEFDLCGKMHDTFFYERGVCRLIHVVVMKRFFLSNWCYFFEEVTLCVGGWPSATCTSSSPTSSSWSLSYSGVEYHKEDIKLSTLLTYLIDYLVLLYLIQCSDRPGTWEFQKITTDWPTHRQTDMKA